MGRAGVVRGWLGLGVNSFDLVGWSGATLLGEVGHRDHQNPKGEQYPSGAPINKLTSISCLPIATRPRWRKAGLMRFESVTIAAGEKARCKSRPQMNRHDCKGRAGPTRGRRGSSM